MKTVMLNIWKLSEYRARSNIHTNKSERKWMSEIENEYSTSLKQMLQEVECSYTKEQFDYYNHLITRFLESRNSIPNEEIVARLNNKLMEEIIKN